MPVLIIYNLCIIIGPLFNVVFIIMKPDDRALARRQIDKRLAPLRDSDALTRPPRGWIKSIRESLGMTTAQLGRRLGVSQPRVTAVEKGELEGSLTLDSLAKAAHALDCRLVYALVPREPLSETILKRAKRKARSKLASTGHSMALEAQSVEPEAEAEHLQRLTHRLLDKAGSDLWDEDE